MSEQKKYLDLEGLSHFWSKNKTYVLETLKDYSKIRQAEGAVSFSYLFEILDLHTRIPNNYRHILKFRGDIYDDKMENVLLEGNFICFGGMGGHVIGFWEVEKNILYSVEKSIDGYEITSSKDINIEGIDATTIEGALAELENNSQGQWTAINNANTTITDHQGRILNLETKIADLETVIEYGTFTSRALYTDQDN